MSLNWNVQACKDVDVLINKSGSEAEKDKLQWMITESVIWLSMTCGYKEITEKNYGEIWWRISVYEQYCGSYISYGANKPYYITLDDIKKRIGLYTNANKITLGKYMKWILKKVEAQGYEGCEMRCNLPAYEPEG